MEVLAKFKSIVKAGGTVTAGNSCGLNDGAAALVLISEKVNTNGGAIAPGHPLGCTDVRLIVTLLHNLERTGGHYGLATLCIGGVRSLATIIEKL